jgi:hypothetical protein
MRRIALLALAILFLAPVLASAPAHAQATRTWVSGVGDDVNPCSRTAPCKTFAGAISKTAANGIINCIDPGGFGAVTITKSITLDCTGTFAGIIVAGTNAINIPTSGLVVNLRGLDIEGAGSGLVGVNITGASTVHIEKCNIFGFQGGAANGISLAPPSAGGRLILDNSHIHTNGNGLSVSGASAFVNATVRNTVIDQNTGSAIAVTSAGNTALVTVDTSLLAFNNTGLGITGTGTIGRIGRSTVTNNTIGVSNSSGTLQSFLNNQISGNVTDGTPITPFPGPGGTALQ